MISHSWLFDSISFLPTAKEAKALELECEAGKSVYFLVQLKEKDTDPQETTYLQFHTFAIYQQFSFFV